MVIQWQSLTLPILPIDVFGRYTMYFHGDAVINGANKHAEVAAHTFMFFDSVGIVWISL